MKTFTRREYNLIHNALKNYELYMSEDDKKTSEIIQDKLYYFNADLLVDNNKNEQELSYVDSLLTTGIDEDKITQEMVNASLNTPMWYEKNND